MIFVPASVKATKTLPTAPTAVHLRRLLANTGHGSINPPRVSHRWVPGSLAIRRELGQPKKMVLAIGHSCNFPVACNHSSKSPACFPVDRSRIRSKKQLWAALQCL